MVVVLVHDDDLDFRNGVLASQPVRGQRATGAATEYDDSPSHWPSLEGAYLQR